MRYCLRCVQPDTRPGIFFSDEGICGGCLWENSIKHLDWKAREQELRDIAQRAQQAKSAYDCVIGVSGGKDSTFQALYARNALKLRCLLVNGEPGDITDIGKQNIENLKQLGFDTISIRPDPKLMRKLYRHDFFNGLNPNRAAEYALQSSVFIIADKFNIPLIIQGNNPGQTAGACNDTGVDGNALNIWQHNTVKENPLDRYKDAVTDAQDLILYHIDMETIRRKGIVAVWLSNYVKEWSAFGNAVFAIRHGLQIRPADMDPYKRGFYRRFSSLDHTFQEVNQLLKHIKFGFGYATDQACEDIRFGHITREEGIYLVRELDGKCDASLIQDFCKLIGITEQEFWKHANAHRGPMWQQDEKSTWKIINPIWNQYDVHAQYSAIEIMRRLGI